MYCPNCDTEIRDEDAQFCPVCGERLMSEAPGEGKKLRYDESFEEEKGKGKFPLIIIFILLAAALILFLLMNDGIRKRLFGEPAVEDINQEETIEEEAETEIEVVNQGERTEEPEEEKEIKEEEPQEAEPEEAEPEEEPQEEPEEVPAEPAREEPREEQVVTTNGQVFPDSSSRYLSDGEIGRLGLSQTQDAINEIYARHGYIFNTESYRKYYENLSWYHGTIPSDQFDDSIFNDYEYENVERLGAHRDALAGQ